MKFGATELFADIADAAERLAHLTNGQGADVTMVSVDVLDSELAGQALESIRKGGTLVITSLGRSGVGSMPVDMMMFPLYQKRIQGSLFGAQPPRMVIPRLIELYRTGDLKIDDLVTQTYRLEAINEAYEDVRNGTVIRPVVEMRH